MLFPVGDLENNYSPNPMVRRHGRGPAGARCKTCRHLTRAGYRSRTYFKCLRYRVSHSTASDFRMKWGACRLYEEEIE